MLCNSDCVAIFVLEIRKNKTKNNNMKTMLQKLTKQLLSAGLIVAASSQIYAQCATTTTVNYQGNGVTNFTNTSTIPSGYSSYISIDFGDGGYYSGSGTSSSTAHTYTSNGMYLVSTFMSSVDPADSMNYCTAQTYDTVIVNDLACSVSLGSVVYNQNGATSSYTFSTSVSASGSADLYWTIYDNMGWGIYTLSGGTSMTYNFTQSGVYTIECVALVNDSLTMTGCSDTSTVSFNVTVGTGGCNLQAGIYAYDAGNLTASIYGYANNSYNVSYLTIDGQMFWNPDSISYTFSAPGTYPVCFYVEDTTIAGYCFDSICSTVTVGSIVPPTPCNASFYIFPDSLNPTVWYGINNSYTANPSATTYLWDFGDGSTSSLPYPSHTYAAPGNYIICLTVSDWADSCTATYCDSSAAFRLSSAAIIGSLTIAAPTGINESINLVKDVKVYPNPMNDQLNVSFTSSVSKDAVVEVVGVLGNVILSEPMNVTAGNNEMKLNTSALSNGVYYVRVVAGDAVLATMKAIK